MALYPLRRFRITENRRETEETFTLIVAPADGEPMFPFKAGQFVMVHVYNEDGTEWAKAAYSIATAPFESKETFELGIKLAGDFTKRLAVLKPGDELGIRGPYGVFTLPSGDEPLVLLAGGIGITPLRSMLREALLAGPPRDIVLFYSERKKEYIAYEAEFRALAKEHPRFHPVFTLTRELPPGWDGETRRVDAALMRSHVPDFNGVVYCMCGPEEFMKNIRATLEAAGVDVKTKCLMERF